MLGKEVEGEGDDREGTLRFLYLSHIVSFLDLEYAGTALVVVRGGAGGDVALAFLEGAIRADGSGLDVS